MDVVVVELIRGRDNRLYPAEHRSAADRKRFATLTHHLRCGRRLSFVLTQDALAAEFGVRRSRGAISKDMRDFRCPICASGAEPTVPGIRGLAVPASSPPGQVTTGDASPASSAPRAKPAVFEWR